VQLETTYFDTAARDLLANRITLRRRMGDLDTGWQLKVPTADARTEIRLPLNGRGVPAELRDLTLGVRRRAGLQPVATLRTSRAIHNLVDAEGTAVAEIVVDDVAADTSRSWREVEVELRDGDEAQLARVAEWLREHGAQHSASGSKLARALDMRSPEPPPAGTACGLIASYLDTQYAAIVGRDIDLRRGRAAVHDARVATRRYRSVLRELHDLLDPVRADHLEAELRWFAGLLGEVRDREVLRSNLDRMIAALPTDLGAGEAISHVDRVLTAEHTAAQGALADAMRGRRYFALLAELRAWHDELPIVEDAPASRLATFLRRAQRRVEKRAAAVPEGAGRDIALHRVRKAAKRARYIAELSEPALGKRAGKVRLRNEELQKRLGDRQDAVVAATFLQRVGLATHADAFTLGVLYQRELEAKTATDPVS
jgi:CHAD domain-containing protein/adenylate cyclase class IV